VMFACEDTRTDKLAATDPEFETEYTDRLLQARRQQCCIPLLTVIGYDCAQPT